MSWRRGTFVEPILFGCVALVGPMSATCAARRKRGEVMAWFGDHLETATSVRLEA